MIDRLQAKLKDLPKTPGVYFHKNAKGDIIYVGKAAVLRNRVRQYFQASRFTGQRNDPKTEALVSEIADVDWMEVDSELDALFLEAEMVRRYMPPYNILLRDDKAMSYIRIDYDSDYPTVTTTRRPLDDGARYFGPYYSTHGVRQALRLLRRVFPFATRATLGQKRVSLHYHIGLDPGLEEGRTSLEEYRANLRKLIAYIQGNKTKIIGELERDMKRAAKSKDFEQAAILRNRLFSLKNLSKQVVFSDKEFQDISKDQALNGLVELLGLKSFPRRIEGYDISHMSGSDVVASMVVFTNGVSNKGEYRKFKTKMNKNDDFYNMRETISRRFSPVSGKTSSKSPVKNNWKLNLPDLMLVDGGKGQVSAALRAMEEANLAIPVIGLAKRIETIILPHKQANGSWQMDEINLPANSHVLMLLQRIRDESHRFAVSYHSVLKTKRQTSSLLDDIPTIGPATRKKLLRTFGSMRGITQARDMELDKVIGTKKATILKQYLRPHRKPDEFDL